MDINPQRVRTAEFRTVRKGADPDEVKSFLGDVADELERAQNQSTAMEARARAAVARLQELSESGATIADGQAQAEVGASVDESETISRTLLLAQRTADSAVADAKAQAERIVSQAEDEAARTLDSTREMSASMLDEARSEARRAGEAERTSIAGEVDALKARRDFLESDVQHLETFLVDQRARLREAATSITDIADRVPGGLGEVRAPLLSAADDDTGEIDMADSGSAGDGDADLTIVTDIADQPDAGDTAGEGSPATEDTSSVETAPPDGAEDDDPWAEPSGDDTVAMPAMPPATPPATGDGGRDGDEEFRFSFDDERS